MGRPSEATSKRLFALSGNRCAFPGCAVVLVEQAANSVGEICHIRARNRGGPRFDAEYPEKDLHSFENLIVLCPTHHTTVDDQSERYTAGVLERMKADHEGKSGRPERLEDIFAARILLGIYDRIVVIGNSGNVVIGSPGAIVARTVIVRTGRKKDVVPPPAGTIGADADAARYVRYLIRQYNKFASQYVDRPKAFHPGVISKNIEAKFRSTWDYLPLEDF